MPDTILQSDWKVNWKLVEQDVTFILITGKTYKGKGLIVKTCLHAEHFKTKEKFNLNTEQTAFQ